MTMFFLASSISRHPEERHQARLEGRTLLCGEMLARQWGEV
jgi:hypothetical protein